MLRTLTRLPPGLLDTDSRGLAERLGGPTLIELPGAREPAVFVALLLHGNETVGWEAIRELLRERLARFGELRLPRALAIFIGNVAAAAAGLRHLPGQPDYNRVWPGSDQPHSPEQTLMSEVVARMRTRGLFASLDLHNNTGTNPHYACLNRLDQDSLQLARLFGRTVVHFLRPLGVQSLAMSALCPAVTLECGKTGDRQGVEHAKSFVDAVLHLEEFPRHPVPPRELDLLHTVARIGIPEAVRFGFAGEALDLLLAPGLEQMNFCELPAGTLFARVNGGSARLAVQDEAGRDVTARYFQLAAGELRLSRPAMPAMLTADTTVIRQDCLGYLMERIALPSDQAERAT